jgi:hypothetical protein
VAIVHPASGEASFTAATIAPAVVIPIAAALVAVNRRISSIRLDDEMNDGLGGFRGCFISRPQKFSYIDDLFQYNESSH